MTQNIIQYFPDNVHEKETAGRAPFTEEPMEQKAKRFGKFNIVDIIAVILILAVVAFAGYKLLGSRGGDAVEQTKIPVTYQAKAECVPVELYENCLDHLPSRMMASGALVNGEIVALEKEPYYVLGPNGEWVEDPYHVTLIFTATTEVAEGNVMLTKVGDQEVRIGKEHIIKSEYIEFMKTTIIDVQWGE